MNRPTTFEPELRRFASADEATAALADTIVSRLARGISEHGKASFVASGGTTPGALFDVLAQRDMAWDRVSVTATDERWVPPSDDRSNEKLLRTRLLKARAARAHLVPLMAAHASPKDAEKDVDRAVAAMPRPFDVTLLGMGTDGHTASLFPEAKELAAALDLSSPALVRAITPPDEARAGLRMSLTLRAILASRLIVVFIRGEAKLDAYRKAAAGQDVLAMPIRAVIHQPDTPVEVYWSP
jgi:6-phosphogluconolactonase